MDTKTFEEKWAALQPLLDEDTAALEELSPERAEKQRRFFRTLHADLRGIAIALDEFKNTGVDAD